ncbi:MAG TPA: DUF488 domain-containing protein [Thermoanaerobaculia bacterium]
MPSRVCSIGHSTRSLDELVALLRENGVATLADVRRYPGSRRYPQFSRESLQAALPAAGIRYEHLGVALGGRRRPAADSPNRGWRSEQFRGYADHMATAEFAAGIDALLALPPPAAVLCAEAVPWRCHRNLLADELTRRGVEVVHIMGPGSTGRHEMNPMAREEGDHLVYPPQEPQTTLF